VTTIRYPDLGAEPTLVVRSLADLPGELLPSQRARS
jgi:hypothetical protein